MKVAVVGATGLVGSVMIKVLEERKFPVTDFIPVASDKSAGKMVSFNGKSYKVVTVEQAVEMIPDIALFSAGGETSLKYAPRFAEKGTIVIDNSSAWRMNPDIKLIVPEINASEITAKDKIIANPNCSTIQLVLVLGPLHRKYGVKRVVVSTYQSVTGTGVKAVNQMQKEREGICQKEDMAYPYKIDQNCIPQCDVFLDNGYTKEEMKLTNETCKILGDNSIKLTATAVRVPVTGGHSESVNVTFSHDFDLDELINELRDTPGIAIVNNSDNIEYPMPLMSQDKDEVFVGRIRRDNSLPNSLNLWVVADNLRKGAATNAVQIAEHLVHSNLIVPVRTRIGAD